MDEYPGNSHNSKDLTSSNDPISEDTSTTNEKKINSVVSGEVIRRKKPIGRRLVETFVGGDARGVWGYVLFDVLIPAAKDTIADAFSQGVERLLFGDARSASRRTGYRPGGTNGYVNYSRYSQSTNYVPGGVNSHRDRDERLISRRARSTHDFDEIVLATRNEATTVIDRMFDLLNKYEQVSVADLYDLVNVSGDYTDNKWGWTDLRGAAVVRVRNGYLLDLPKPEPLDRDR